MAKLSPSNYIGCIVGGAVGDALGAPTEFMSLSKIIDTYGSNGVNDYVEFADGTGEITDDTQMLLFTAEGLLRSFHRATNRGIWGAYLIICFKSYLRWLHTQRDRYADNATSGIELNGWLIKESFLYKRRAPGATCLTALRNGIPGSMSNPINNSKGCGGIMRTAPVGLLFHKNSSEAFKIGAELAALTHGHASGYLSAGFLASMISHINNGETLIKSIDESLKILKTYEHYEEVEQAVTKALNLYNTDSPSYKSVELLGEGWVAEEALSISIYCALSYQDDFEKGINLSINHSGDTDSTGSITGNILGLILGDTAIPNRWIKNLSHMDKIKTIALDLHSEVKGNGYDYHDKEWENKYPSY